MFLKCEKGQHLSAGEQIAIDYINEHVDSIASLTITDIAELAFISASTVSRAIRKCGITSMTDVRYKIAAGEWAKKNFVVNEILEKSYTDCVKTIERIDTTSILKIVEYIRKARIVHILAGGVTRLAAQEFEFSLQSQGINAYLQWDSGVTKRLKPLVEPEDLVIIFSVQNNTEDLVVGAEAAKKKGAKVVTCCCTEGTTLEEFSDITVIAYSQKTVRNKDFRDSSRLGLQIIVRTIVEYLAVEE